MKRTEMSTLYFLTLEAIRNDIDFKRFTKKLTMNKLRKLHVCIDPRNFLSLQF